MGSVEQTLGNFEEDEKVTSAGQNTTKNVLIYYVLSSILRILDLRAGRVADILKTVIQCSRRQNPSVLWAITITPSLIDTV